MSEASAIALIFSDGDSSRMLREVIGAIGCPIAYEASVVAFTPQALKESGATVVVVDLGPEVETNAVFDLVDDDQYRVIVNDAEVTSALSGWEHARWARHLAAKILQLPAVVDPPRPTETSMAAVDAIASMKPKTSSASQEPDVATGKHSSSSVDLGIDDWLSGVLQVKNPAGLFAETDLREQDGNDSTNELTSTVSAQSVAPQTRRKSDQDSAAETESVSASAQPVEIESTKPAAEERFDVNIDNVLRDIEDWLPPADSDLTSTEPRALNSHNGGRSEEARDPASDAPAMNRSRDGDLARPLELTPLEDAARTPSRDDKSSARAREMVVEVVTSAATVSRVIVLCASVGGPEAIRDLLGAIPASFRALFLVVQQVGDDFVDLLSQQLRRTTSLRVRSADVGDQLRNGDVVAVPPRQRLVIDRSGRVTLNQRVEHAKESPINQMLRDVSDQFGEACTVVVLSGVESDAADGCRYVCEHGGRVYAQAPTSCVSSGMVEQVKKTGVVTFLGTPTELAAHLLLDRR